MVGMRLFRRAGRARNKWRRQAWLVDPNRTRIIIVKESEKPLSEECITEKLRRVPSWVGRELDPSIRDILWMSNVRKEYGVPR